MKTVDLNYYVVFGSGDGTEWMPWDVELTDEEEKIYDHAIANKLPLNEIPELQDARSRAYDEIEEQEIQNAIDWGDDDVLEWQGMYRMDCDELNELVEDRDPYTLEFFGLQDATEEELDAWDAEELDDDAIPYIKDFDKDFEPESPFDIGWSLSVLFVDPNDLDD